MKRRFTEEQITGFLREAEAGVAIKDLCRRHGFSEDRPKKAIGGMTPAAYAQYLANTDIINPGLQTRPLLRAGASVGSRTL